MVKIRLTRLGKHKAPVYRIVATDSRVKRDGKYIALIGTYEPFSGQTKINSELAIKFLSNGAQPTETILNMFKQKGIWAEYLKTKISKKVKHTRKITNKKHAAKKAKTKKVKASPKAETKTEIKVEEKQS